MKKWDKFTKDEIQKIINESNNYREVAKKLGYTGSGKNDVVRKMANELKLDTSNLNNNAKKGNFDYSKFTYGRDLKGSSMLPAIEALRGHKCENCGLETWFEKPIALEVHHIDGDRLNNNLDNLKLLCLNCHAITSNWKRKKTASDNDDYVSDDDIIRVMQYEKNLNIRQILIKSGLSDHGNNYKRIRGIANKLGIVLPQIKSESNYCVDCGCEIFSESKRCVTCNNKLIIKNWFDRYQITRDELKIMIRTISFVEIGKKFNVSDNTIRKWCKKFGLPHRTIDIKKYSNEEWELI